MILCRCGHTVRVVAAVPMARMGLISFFKQTRKNACDSLRAKQCIVKKKKKSVQ